MLDCTGKENVGFGVLKKKKYGRKYNKLMRLHCPLDTWKKLTCQAVADSQFIFINFEKRTRKYIFYT